jgi:hypothetical protein
VRKFKRRCDCGVCVRCRNHERYLRERDVRLVCRGLAWRESVRVRDEVLRDFQGGVIGLDELRDFLESGGK